MNRKLTGEDISLLNEFIISTNQDLSRLGRQKLSEYIRQPDAFADSIAKDWAYRIFRRISRPDGGPTAHA